MNITYTPTEATEQFDNKQLLKIFGKILKRKEVMRGKILKAFCRGCDTIEGAVLIEFERFEHGCKGFRIDDTVYASWTNNTIRQSLGHLISDRGISVFEYNDYFKHHSGI